MYKYSGRLDLPRKLAAALLLALAVPAAAFEPVQAIDAVWVEGPLVEYGLEHQGWTLPAWSNEQGAELRQLLDEQIFTELSPILESDETIRLPQDQLLSD